MPFCPWWPWPLTLTNVQTRPSEGSNMSSLWIWRKSVQRFPEIFHTQTKKSQRQKQNFTQFTACGKELESGQFCAYHYAVHVHSSEKISPVELGRHSVCTLQPTNVRQVQRVVEICLCCHAIWWVDLIWRCGLTSCSRSTDWGYTVARSGCCVSGLWREASSQTEWERHCSAAHCNSAWQALTDLRTCPTPAISEGIEYLQSRTHTN